MNDSQLYLALQTEKVGMTKGSILAFGLLDLEEVELFKKQNSSGNHQQKLSVPLDFIDGSGNSLNLIVTLRFQPSAAALKGGPAEEEKSNADLHLSS
mmetsp:Transcript_5802/g.9269  ORF Transcript_5802/g.9269 Transcript_5802/m.9269 type:complete len:97 (+) Transcript_5802:4024-4314(+)